MQKDWFYFVAFLGVLIVFSALSSLFVSKPKTHTLASITTLVSFGFSVQDAGYKTPLIEQKSVIHPALLPMTIIGITQYE